MKLRFAVVVLTTLLINLSTYAQIGVFTQTPHSSSALEVFSSDKGILIPSIALTSTMDVTTIASPATSLLVYNTTNSGSLVPGFYYWDSRWIPIETGLSIPDWSVDGNQPVGGDFVGTTNLESLRIRINNIERLEFTVDDQIIFSNDQIRIGNIFTTTADPGSTAIGIRAFARGIGGLGFGARSNGDNIGATGIGYDSFASAINSTAVGRLATSNGTRSTAFSFRSAASSQESLAVGRRATSDGIRSIALGIFARNDVFNRSIALGFQGVNTGNNQLRYGNITEIDQVNAAVVNASDGRFKYDISANVPGLDFIDLLRPVTYKFDIEKLNDFLGNTHTLENSQRIRSGFIAQEVEQAVLKLDYNFDGLLVPADKSKENYKVNYTQFVVPLVKSVQELSDKIDQLQQDQVDIDLWKNDLEKLKELLSTE